MKKPYKDLKLKQRTPEWLTFRSTGLGGSEIASVLATDSADLSELVWTPPIKLFYEKIGEPVQPFTGNTVTEEGHFQEPAIIERFKYYDLANPDAYQMHQNRKNKIVRNQVRNHNGVFQNPKWDFLFYSPDSLYLREGKRAGLLESKLSTSNEAKRYTNRISPAFFLQVMMGLMVTELPVGYICLLVDGQWFEVIPVEPDKEVFEWIETVSARFWINVIKARQIKLEYEIDYYMGRNPDTLTSRQQDGVLLLQDLEPSLIGSAREVEFIKSMIEPKTEELVREGTQDEWVAIGKYIRAGNKEKELAAEKQLAYTEVLRDLGGYNKIDFGKENGFYSYKADKNGKASIYINPKLKEVIG